MWATDESQHDWKGEISINIWETKRDIGNMRVFLKSRENAFMCIEEYYGGKQQVSVLVKVSKELFRIHIIA